MLSPSYVIKTFVVICLIITSKCLSLIVTLVIDKQIEQSLE
jgi:hypothetical protein